MFNRNFITLRLSSISRTSKVYKKTFSKVKDCTKTLKNRLFNNALK